MRKQAAQICRGDQSCMDNKVAFTQEGFESFTATFVLGCEKWKNGIVMTGLSDAVKDLQKQGALNSHKVENR